MIESGVRIGDAVNLLYGFKPLWDASDTENSPLLALPENPTTIFEPSIVQGEDEKFGFPIITIHDNVQSLFDSLYEYKVLPFKGEEKNFNINSGALIVNHPDQGKTIAQLSRYVGVDLNGEYSYMLVKLGRLNGKASHEVIRKTGAKSFDKQLHLTKEGRLAMSRLRAGKRLGCDQKYDAMITEQQAKGYIDFFYNFGTHFVSALYFGDYIFQVFAYAKKDFEGLKNAYENDCVNGRVEGSFAVSYSYYTGRKLVAEYGHIVIKSGDPEFKKSLEDNEWLDERYAKGNSIFAAFTKHIVAQTTFLSRFKKVIPTGFELTPLSRFIEIFRSFSWQRILKGALLARYGDWVEFNVPRIKKDYWHFTSEDREEGLLSKIEASLINVSSGEVQICRNIVDAEKLGIKAAKKFRVFSNVLKVPENAIISLPGCAVALSSYVVDTAEESHKAPHLVVSDNAFEGFALWCGKMCGVLWVENRSATKRYLIIDGFCFEEGKKDQTTGRLKVVLRSMKTVPLKPSAKDLGELLAIRLILNCEDQQNISESLTEALSYLEWLKELTDGKPEDKEFNNIIIGLKEELKGQQKRSSEEAHLMSKMSTFFIEKKKEYDEITRHSISNLKKFHEQEIFNEAVLKELEFLLFYYLDNLKKLRGELEKTIEMIHSKKKIFFGYKLINEINKQHTREEGEIKCGLEERAKIPWLVELTYKIRFQKKQIHVMLEMLRGDRLEQKEGHMFILL